jgi:glucose/arabinose dehydrogenase
VRGPHFHVASKKEGRAEGIRTFAFHPDFSTPGTKGFGKFYTVHTESPGSTPDNRNVRIFAGPSENFHHQDVITEWTIDSEYPDRIDPDSRRELMRIEQPALSHNTGQVAFNPNTNPGDADHGMMYIAVGDGGYFPRSDKERQRRGQNTGMPFGTILRIDPLRNGTSPYSVPRDNPFVDDANFLPEIWAFGLRNPQRFGWDTGGDGKMLIADIGESNIEEINLGVPGANYGWSEREGTFVVSDDDKSVLFALPADEAPGRFTYPVAQYDHGDGIAIVGGFVYRGSWVPGLFGKYIFGDIVTGRIFYLDADDLVIGRQAVIHELTLLRNGVETTLLDILGRDRRADLRFGMGEDGEIYILTKRDGMIRTWYRPFTSP